MKKITAKTYAQRLLVLAAVPVFALGALTLTGCGSSDEPAGSAPAAEASKEEAPESDYAVTIDNCTVTTDYEGAPAIIVDYSFTNNSDDAQCFGVACHAQAFQNGVELEYAVVEEDLGNGDYAEIKPGATTQVRLAYKLADQSEVSIEVEETFSFEDVMLAEKTFSVA